MSVLTAQYLSVQRRIKSTLFYPFASSPVEVGIHFKRLCVRGEDRIATVMTIWNDWVRHETGKKERRMNSGRPVSNVLVKREWLLFDWRSSLVHDGHSGDGLLRRDTLMIVCAVVRFATKRLSMQPTYSCSTDSSSVNNYNDTYQPTKQTNSRCVELRPIE